MNEIELATNDFGKSVRGGVLGVACKQFQVIVAHVQKDNVAEGKNRQIISQDNPLLAVAAAEELLHNDDTILRAQSL